MQLIVAEIVVIISSHLVVVSGQTLAKLKREIDNKSICVPIGFLNGCSRAEKASCVADKDSKRGGWGGDEGGKESIIHRLAVVSITAVIIKLDGRARLKRERRKGRKPLPTPPPKQTLALAIFICSNPICCCSLIVSPPPLCKWPKWLPHSQTSSPLLLFQFALSTPRRTEWKKANLATTPICIKLDQSLAADCVWRWCVPVLLCASYNTVCCSTGQYNHTHTQADCSKALLPSQLCLVLVVVVIKLRRWSERKERENKSV